MVGNAAVEHGGDVVSFSPPPVAVSVTLLKGGTTYCGAVIAFAVCRLLLRSKPHIGAAGAAGCGLIRLKHLGPQRGTSGCPYHLAAVATSLVLHQRGVVPCAGVGGWGLVQGRFNRRVVRPREIKGFIPFVSLLTHATALHGSKPLTLSWY